MADRNIPDMDALTTPSLTDLLEIYSGGVNKKVTLANLLKASGIHYKFPIAFDDAGLEDGVTVFTPAAGDVLIDAWPEITEAWDGSSPQGEFILPGSTYGLMYDVVGRNFDMALPDVATGSATAPANGSYARSADETLLPMQPVHFTSTDALKFFVAVGGTPGADPGASQGAGFVHFIISHPIEL